MDDYFTVVADPKKEEKVKNTHTQLKTRIKNNFHNVKQKIVKKQQSLYQWYKKHMLIINIVVVVVIAIGLGLGYWYWKKDQWY